VFSEAAATRPDCQVGRLRAGRGVCLAARPASHPPAAVLEGGRCGWGRSRRSVTRAVGATGRCSSGGRRGGAVV